MRASARPALAIRRSLKLLACAAALVLVDAAVIAVASLGLIDLSQEAYATMAGQVVAGVAPMAAVVQPRSFSLHTAASIPEPVTQGNFDRTMLPFAASDIARFVATDLKASNQASAVEEPRPLPGSRMATLFDKEPALEAPAAPPAPPPVWTPTLPGAPGWFGPGACAQHELAAPIGAQTLVWPADSHSVSGYTYSVWHPGIDVTALYGTPIYAIDTGVVAYAGWNDAGYGNFVIVDHGDGQWSAYAHLSQVLVKCSAAVTQGQLIGLAGATGNATGSHLHFEIFQAGVGQINPWPRLP